MATWESRFLIQQPKAVSWRFQFEEPNWREAAKDLDEGKFMKEEENHFYQKENCPSGANFFASASKPIFNESESINKKNDNVKWMFSYGDQEFRRRALTVPNCVHVKELEFHEFHKKDGQFEQRACPKPAPILPPIDCAIADDCDTCKPPVRLCPPCLPGLPPPPPPSCCIPYPNTLGEKEWHTIRKVSATAETAGDENESVLYERNIKSCDPCMLPQVSNGRMYAMPGVSMRPGEMDKYSPESPPCAEDLPPSFNYKEDQGECNKRETRGPGVYPGSGYLPGSMLNMPGNVPCGYHFSEKQAHVHCASGGGGAAAEAEKPKIRAPPRPPPCPPPVACPPPQPCYPCGPYPCVPCGPCGPCRPYGPVCCR